MSEKPKPFVSMSEQISRDLEQLMLESITQGIPLTQGDIDSALHNGLCPKCGQDIEERASLLPVDRRRPHDSLILRCTDDACSAEYPKPKGWRT